MQLIAISRLRNDASRYPDVKKQIENWYTVVKNARGQNLEVVYSKHFLTHAEYDKGNWKNDSYF